MVVENRKVNGRRAVKTGDLVVVNTKEAGDYISLTTRPGDCIDDTDNVHVVNMRSIDVGIVVGRADGGMGTEYLILTRGTYGWNMARYFSRVR